MDCLMAEGQRSLLLHENDWRVPNRLENLGQICALCPMQIRRKKDSAIILVHNARNTDQHSPKLLVLEFSRNLLKLALPCIGGVGCGYLYCPMILARDAKWQRRKTGFDHSQLDGQKTHRRPVEAEHAPGTADFARGFSLSIFAIRFGRIHFLNHTHGDELVGDLASGRLAEPDGLCEVCARGCAHDLK